MLAVNNHLVLFILSYLQRCIPALYSQLVQLFNSLILTIYLILTCLSDRRQVYRFIFPSLLFLIVLSPKNTIQQDYKSKVMSSLISNQKNKSLLAQSINKPQSADPITELLEQTLNNKTSKLSSSTWPFYLLLKKQKENNYISLYLTDFYSRIWMKKLNYEYLTGLKNRLKLKTDMRCFLDHLGKGIQEDTSIGPNHNHQADQIALQVSLKISAGLVIKCTINVDDQFVSIDTDIQEFKNRFRKFGQLFYSAMHYQQKQALILVDIIKQKPIVQQHKNKQSQSDRALANKIFGGKETKIVSDKNKDLINPFKKRRRGLGMKIGVGVSNKEDSDQD